MGVKGKFPQHNSHHLCRSRSTIFFFCSFLRSFELNMLHSILFVLLFILDLRTPPICSLLWILYKKKSWLVSRPGPKVGARGPILILFYFF